MNNNKKPSEPAKEERWVKIEKEVQELKRSRSILSIGLFLLSGLYGILILCIILRIIRILVGELAKLLCQNGVQIGQNRLFSWMREHGYLIRDPKRSDYNMPTQRAVEMCLFEIKETTVVHSDGHTSINKTPKVTGKGQIYFVNQFLNGRAKRLEA